MNKNIIVSFFLCISFYSHAQDNKTIEKDLKRYVDRLVNFSDSTHIGNISKDTLYDARIKRWQHGEDSIMYAADLFEKRLLYYTENFPSTLTYDFKALTGIWNGYLLHIITSSDSLFRIYIWNDCTGFATASSQNYRCVYQYRCGNTVKSYSPPQFTKDSNYIKVEEYDSIFTLILDNKINYLVKYMSAYPFNYAIEGFKAFSIENGGINDSIRLFKIDSSIYNNLYYGFNNYATDFVAIEKPTILNITLHHLCKNVTKYWKTLN